MLIEGEDADGSRSFGFARCAESGKAELYCCLSGSRERVGQLVDLLNELEPEPLHLDDIVEDFLTDFKI